MVFVGNVSWGDKLKRCTKKDYDWRRVNDLTTRYGTILLLELSLRGNRRIDLQGNILRILLQMCCAKAMCRTRQWGGMPM